MRFSIYVVNRSKNLASMSSWEVEKIAFPFLINKICGDW
jgi:hypothetical protein